jgi:type I restriction enzyme M protein
MLFEEFEPEKKWWNKRKENEHAWKVGIEDIKARGYNLDFKNPRAVDSGPGDAEKLLKQYRELTAKVVQARDTLRNELKTALERSRE